jgi:hypothetical protein
MGSAGLSLRNGLVSSGTIRRKGLSGSLASCVGQSGRVAGTATLRCRGVGLIRAQTPAKGPEGSGTSSSTSGPGKLPAGQQGSRASVSAEAVKHLERLCRVAPEPHYPAGTLASRHRVPRASVSARIDALKSVDADIGVHLA